MATFAQSSFDSGNYAAARPTYPRLLYDAVLQFHRDGPTNADTNKWDRAVDVGCGTGQATLELLTSEGRQGFQSVIAVDPSPNMIQVAKESVPQVFKSRIEFYQSTVEDLSFIADGTIDLVTAAQCAHWFDWDRAWPELERVLKPGGTFAFWGYTFMRLTEHPELTPLITAYAQGSDPETSLGPHWEPGRKILDDHYLDVAPPASGWSDFTRVFYTGHHYAALPAPTQDVIIRKSMTWGAFANYLGTFSALHRYREAFPGDRERADGDIAARFQRTLMEAAGSPEQTALVEVEWPLALVMVHKA
ncbi:S-adenosyl-L-methionine-dependent methyltransferase [Mycena sanguinolenta]|nr:S-adenosyl-L-methionine-dependent methyltransferase [Mycena sanguinolenta]